MNTIYWNTKEPLRTTAKTMADYLANINMLDIKVVDGSYAEGVNALGHRYEIHASGDGDEFSHKIEFKRIAP